MLDNSQIHLRDPYVYVEGGVYYLYGTTGRNAWDGPGEGFDVYTGADLTHWEGPFPAFRPGKDFWGTMNFWAPEMHAYQGRYYLLASFKSPAHCRGTAVLRADSPMGPFEPLSQGAVTPADWECLDGTLYVEDGQPYMIFCHEWKQVDDGTMCLMPLSSDLSAAAGEPVTLFKATDAPWVRSHDGSGAHFVTDGPFLHRAGSGALLMLWSSFGEEGYAIGYAVSQSGAVRGPWRQCERPIFAKDGGHGMLFTDLKGRLRLPIHSPNTTGLERPLFLTVRERGDALERI